MLWPLISFCHMCICGHTFVWDKHKKCILSKCCRSNFLCYPDFLRELVMFFLLLFDDLKQRKLHSRRERQSQGMCTFHGTMLWTHKYLCNSCLFNRIAWMKYRVEFGIQSGVRDKEWICLGLGRDRHRMVEILCKSQNVRAIATFLFDWSFQVW